MRRRPFALSLALNSGENAMSDNVYRYDALDTVRLDTRSFPPDHHGYDTDHDTGSLCDHSRTKSHVWGF